MHIHIREALIESLNNDRRFTAISPSKSRGWARSAPRLDSDLECRVATNQRLNGCASSRRVKSSDHLYGNIGDRRARRVCHTAVLVYGSRSFSYQTLLALARVDAGNSAIIFTLGENNACWGNFSIGYIDPTIYTRNIDRY